MNWNDKHKVFFVGIGGIGMSALARHLLSQGKSVFGYDKVPSSITSSLETLGAEIVFDWSVESIPQECLSSEQTLIIYTPAIPKEHPQLNYFIAQQFQVYKRSEILGLLSKDTYCIAIGGTHGKTTTSTLLTHLLLANNSPVTAFLGGVSENFKTNYVNNGSELMVVEADEYDRSFLTLDADMACLTSIDADHLDIYSTVEDLRTSFNEFANKVKNPDRLFHHVDLPFKGKTYGVETPSDYRSDIRKVENGAFVFDLIYPEGRMDNLRAVLPGRHNVANTTAACAMALQLGCGEVAIRKGLDSFLGIQRRFSYRMKSPEFTLIDDYAHHPSEINAVYNAVAEMYPGQTTAVVFQPHLFSRTRDFAEEFAASLSRFAQTFLLPIYPAREKPMMGVTSEWLLSLIENDQKAVIQKSEIASAFIQSGASIGLLLGAGDIGLEVEQIVSHLNRQNELG